MVDQRIDRGDKQSAMAHRGSTRTRNQIGRWVLRQLAEASEHIRTCPRCERLFLVAYEASADQSEENRPAVAASTDVWLIIKEQLREFRQCADWPKGA